MKCCSSIRSATMSNGWIVHWFKVWVWLHLIFCSFIYTWLYNWIQYLKKGLWNHVFLFSNLSLFVLLPFAYLFAESSGFFGHRKGIISRAYETFTVFSLLAVVVLGITYIVSAIIYPEKRGLRTLLSMKSSSIFTRQTRNSNFFCAYLINRFRFLSFAIFIFVCIISRRPVTVR